MQIKTIVNNGFGEILREVQEAVQDGWEIDFSNQGYPTNNFTYYEITLNRKTPVGASTVATDSPVGEPKKAGRPVTKK